LRTRGAALRVGATALLVVAIAWITFKFVAKGLKSERGYEVWALFHDATGLVDKSRVQIAGLIIGEIKDRRLQGHMARVTLRIKPDVVIWSNAVIYKKSASLLGEFYLEIDPGTPEAPDPLTGELRRNYVLQGCEEVMHDPECNQVRNVVEVVTTTDVLTQMNETLPVLRDILVDVQKLTGGPMQQIAKEVQTGVKANSEAVEKLLIHIDAIAQDLHGITTPDGRVYRDLQESMDNIRNITASVKGLIGTGEGQVQTAGDKLKKDLDALAVSLDKFNRNLDQVNDLTGRVARGEGTVGKLLTDDSIARNVGDIAEDTSNFVRSVARLQTIVGIREEYYLLANSWKTYFSLRLQPRPDKYYLLEFVDDPRGSIAFNHQFQTVSGPGTPTMTTAACGAPGVTCINTDNWSRSSAFRFSFLFAKRIEFWKWFGLTGLVGIKESTGGVGMYLDAWRQRLQLQIDLFDFSSENLPRLKVWAAVEVFKHAWLTAGIDDILNQPREILTPGATTAGQITCGPATPQSWCRGGRDYFFGAMLTFNDDDLRALLTIGGAAIAGAGVSAGK
jgi:phospholipid/cholesterol/gamma-HCH transport system substrate-binding protein